jgi:chaperone modulatory protein CbpM
VTAALTRPRRLDLESFSHAAGLHPDLVRRFVALGLLDATTDGRGGLWFSPSQLAAAARLQRLRAGFSLNYAALGLVVALLDRVAELEAALRHQPGPTTRTPARSPATARPQGGRSWT